jgi:iron(III) transport system permease protein
MGAAVVVFLLAFAEFEIASLLGIHTWTVALFDAQVGGLALAASLRLAVPALLWQGVPLLLVLALITLRRSPMRDCVAMPARTGRVGTAAAWAHLAAALAAVTVVPAWIVLHGTLRGLALIGQTQALGRDVAASVVVAAMTAPAVYLLAGWLLSAGRQKRASSRPAPGWRRWRVGLCVVGLLGPLIVSLAALRLFQVPGLRIAYDTAVPLVLAQVIVLLPFGVLLRALLAARRPGESVHAGALLLPSPGAAGRRARHLLWALVGRGTFWAVFLLFCWAYLDLTASAVLSPSRMTPVMVRLYNFMHYGRTSLLSAMVCVAFLVPFAVLLVAEGARRGIAWCLTR